MKRGPKEGLDLEPREPLAHNRSTARPSPPWGSVAVPAREVDPWHRAGEPPARERLPPPVSGGRRAIQRSVIDADRGKGASSVPIRGSRTVVWPPRFGRRRDHCMHLVMSASVTRRPCVPARPRFWRHSHLGRTRGSDGHAVRSLANRSADGFVSTRCGVQRDAVDSDLASLSWDHL